MSNRKRIIAVAVSMALAGVAQRSLANVDNTWTGAVNQDYNNPGNWALGHLPTNASNPQEDALINTATGNFPTITADFTNPPTDMFVGRDAGSTALLNQSAGTAANAGGNWMFIGADGATGTWNVANTAATGGTFTHFGQGSGSINDTGRLYIGGRQTNGPGTGTFNVNTSGTVTVGNDLSLGASGGNGTMNLDAGSVSVGGWMKVGSDENGNTGTGALNMSGGSITMPTGGARFAVGMTGSTGKFTMAGGTVNITASTADTPVVVGADSSAGTFNMTGGTFNTTGEMWFGQGRPAAGPGNGLANITGGTVNVSNWIAVGREGGQGTLNVGGTAVINKTGSTDITIGTGAGGNGALNVSGGFISTARNLLIAENDPSDTGLVYQTGGTVRVVANVVVQQNGTGSYQLSGGKLIVDGAFNNTNGGSFSFTGGTLTRDDTAAPLSILGDLAPGDKSATLGLDGGKTFTLTGTLNVDPGLSFDLTGRAIPTTPGSTGAMALGTVGGILGTFDTTSNPVVGLSNPGNATYIDELAGESHSFTSSQSVYWLQESGGQVSLNYSIAQAVPEPMSIGAFVLTGAALLARRRRR